MKIADEGEHTAESAFVEVCGLEPSPSPRRGVLSRELIGL